MDNDTRKGLLESQFQEGFCQGDRAPANQVRKALSGDGVAYNEMGTGLLAFTQTFDTGMVFIAYY